MQTSSPTRAQGPRTPQPQPQPAKPPRVDVIELHPVNAQGSLRAFAAVTLAGKLTIRDCRVIQQEGQAPWVAMPTKSWVDQKDGRTKYRPLVDVPADWAEAIQVAVLAAWERLQETGELPDAQPTRGGARR